MAKPRIRRYEYDGMMIAAMERKGEQFTFYEAQCYPISPSGKIIDPSMVFRVIKEGPRRWVSSRYPGKPMATLEQAITYTVRQEQSGG